MRISVRHAGIHLLRLAVAVSLAQTTIEAQAAGFGIDFESAAALGTATAGSAHARDATTIFYNPAGMALLARTEWIAGGQLFMFHDRFADRGSTILGGTQATPGGPGEDAIPLTLIPWMFASGHLSPDLSIGVGVFAPFGLRTDYGSEFVGRYQSELAALTVLDLNPAIAYQVAPGLSIGAGLTVEYARVQLKQAIDFGSACAVALGAAPCVAAFGLQPGKSDGHVETFGHSWKAGWSMGAIAEPAAGTRIGISYRSRINHHFGSARQSFDVPPGARAFLAAAGNPLALTGSDVSTDLPLPARLTIGAAQSLGDRLDVMLDATLTKWGVLRTTVITARDPVAGASVVIDQNYKDAWRYAIGLNYAWNDRWQLRGGIAYDETPIPAASVQASLPDRDRLYFAIGASYRFTDAWSADIGYTYVRYVGKVPIDRTTPNGDRLFGSFDVGGQIATAQLRYQY